MLILWRLMFGHLMGDFTFQTNFINRWKRTSLWGMLVHCGTHPVLYIALCYPFLAESWVEAGPLRLSGWWCIAIIFVSHFMEDWWRVYTIYRYDTPDNTLYFAWDQIIHWAVIFSVIPVGSISMSASSLIPEKWPVLGCLFVLATHGATVLVYFIEKDLYGRVFPGFQEKYTGMLERLVLAGCFLIPGKLWLLLALGWVSVMHTIRQRRMLDLSWMSFWLGGGVAIVCGVAARLVFYRL